MPPKVVYQFGNDGNFIDKFESETHASNFLSVNMSSIAQSIISKTIYKGKWFFSFVNKFDPRERMKKNNRQKLQPIYCFDKNCKLVDRYYNIYEASAKTKVTETSIKSSIYRKTFCKKKYYFSLETTFSYPEKGHNQNPVLNKVSVYKKLQSKKKPKLFYIFDRNGKVLHKPMTVDKIVETTGIDKSTVSSSMSARSLCFSKYYFLASRRIMQSVMKKQPKIYCFDVTGAWKRTYRNILEIAEEYKVEANKIYTYINQAICFRKEIYLSRKRMFGQVIAKKNFLKQVRKRYGHYRASKMKIAI